MEFEPVIVGFLCNWCSYTGADLAGTARIKHRPNLRVIRVMCSGRVDPTFVLKAFAGGADGVMICGCHPGDCHYLEGNDKAFRRHQLLERLMDAYGIEKQRLRLEWVSASEGERFARLVDEMTAQLKDLGPLEMGPQLADIGAGLVVDPAAPATVTTGEQEAIHGG